MTDSSFPAFEDLPEVVRRHTMEDGLLAIRRAARLMEGTGVYSLVEYPMCNRAHDELYGARKSLDGDWKAVRAFMLEVFPRPYLEEMEKFRPGVLDLNGSEER